MRGGGRPIPLPIQAPEKVTIAIFRLRDRREIVAPMRPIRTLSSLLRIHLAASAVLPAGTYRPERISRKRLIYKGFP